MCEKHGARNKSKHTDSLEKILNGGGGEMKNAHLEAVATVRKFEIPIPKHLE